MPASWQPEAVQGPGGRGAHLRHLVARPVPARRYYQICDTSSCQVYGGVGRRGPAQQRGRRRRPRGQILTYDGEAGVHAVLARAAAAGPRPGACRYLAAKADPYDDYAGNPVHAWTVTLGAARIERAYPAIGTLNAASRVTRRDGNGEWRRPGLDAGRSTARKSDVTVSGDTFRGAASACAPPGSPSPTRTPGSS